MTDEDISKAARKGERERNEGVLVVKYKAPRESRWKTKRQLEKRERRVRRHENEIEKEREPQ